MDKNLDKKTADAIHGFKRAAEKFRIDMDATGSGNIFDERLALLNKKSVPNSLRDAAKIYEERNKLYGDSYKHYGSVVKSLFPDGIKLENDDDHNRFGVLTMMISKLTRYCGNFKPTAKEGFLQHVGHADSLDDLAVYSMMLKELDDEFNKNENAAMLEEIEQKR